MRVLISSRSLPPFSYGGIGIYTDHLARALAALGHTVHVVTAGRALSRQVGERLFLHYVRPEELSDSTILTDAIDWGRALHRAVEEIDRRWGVDIVESPNSPPEGLLLAESGLKPVVVRVSTPAALWQKHDGWPIEGDRAALVAAEARLLRTAAGLIGVSRAVLADALRDIAPQGRQVVVPLGLPADYGEAAPLPDTPEYRVLALTRLQPTKGARALLAAIPRVLAGNPAVRFDLLARDVAPWTFHRDFEREHPDLLDRVRFRAHESEEGKKELLRRCHVVVAPSHYESFGIMYVEAMAFARPVIGCPVGGVPEIVADGETGLLVKPDDEAALAKAVLALAADRARGRTMGEAGRRRFLDLFTAERMARKTTAFLEQVGSRP